MPANSAKLRSISPFFIVGDLRTAVDYYSVKLGFESRLEIPAEKPFFALVARDGVTITLKEIGPDTPPLANHQRHEWARWDAFIETTDPDALYDEFCDRSATIHVPLANTEEGLRAFEVRDADGYVLCFGCQMGS